MKRKPPKSIRQQIAAANRNKHSGAIALAVKIAGVPKPVAEYCFCPGRKWRFDFAWPCARVAIEVNGGGARGRHNTITGATKDAEKLNAAACLGWRVLVYTAISVKDVNKIADDLKAILTGV